MHLSLPEAALLVEPSPAAYVLLGSDGRYLYKGACRNLRERLTDHRAGRAPRTKNRRPLILVYYRQFESYADALRHERYLKTGHGRAWLRRRLDQNPEP